MLVRQLRVQADVHVAVLGLLTVRALKAPAEKPAAGRPFGFAQGRLFGRLNRVTI